jgi:hypothetical protein
MKTKTKYYFDGEKIHSTTNKVTKKWIYAKNYIYPNSIGNVYSSKKSAIKAYIKNLKQDIKILKDDIDVKNIEIHNIQLSIKKLEKIIS